MKILFADQFSEPGGAQQCLMDLLPEVIHRGWQPLVMAPGNGDLIKWCAENHIPTRSLPLSGYSSGHKNAVDAMRFAVEWPRVRAAIRGAVREHGCDLLYVNGPRVLPAVAGLGVSGIFHAHSQIGGGLARGVIRGVLKRERMPIIAVSGFVAAQFSSQPVKVIYNGVADCGCAGVKRQTGLTVGMLGRIAPEKGQLDFVRAARLLRAESSTMHFQIFGAPLFSGDEYEHAVRNACIESGVELRGWQSPSAAFAGIDILAVPSTHQEAAGRVIPEAFSAGVPVVAYPSGGIPELIDHRRTGLLTEARSPESLAKSILELAAQPELRHCLSEAARCEWQQRFTLQLYRQKICEQILHAASR